MITNKKILVTGGSGFIGTSLCAELIRTENDVVVFNRRKNRNTQKLIKRGATFIQGSVTDKDCLAIAMKGMDIVFHLATTNLPEGTEALYREVNVLGTKNVMELALENSVTRLVQCTTGGVLGTIRQPPGNEDTPYNPGNVNQRANMEMEKMGKAYYKEKGLSLAAIRSCGIYGPGDRKHLLLFKIIQRGIFPIIANNKRKRDMIYIDDFVQALILAAEKKKAIGKIYHATNEWVTIEDIARWIAETMGVKTMYIKVPTEPLILCTSAIEKLSNLIGIKPVLFKRRTDFFLEQRYLDSSRIREELGFNPETGCMSGLRKTYDWYLKEGWL